MQRCLVTEVIQELITSLGIINRLLIGFNFHSEFTDLQVLIIYLL